MTIDLSNVVEARTRRTYCVQEQEEKKLFQAQVGAEEKYSQTARFVCGPNTIRPSNQIEGAPKDGWKEDANQCCQWTLDEHVAGPVPEEGQDGEGPPDDAEHVKALVPCEHNITEFQVLNNHFVLVMNIFSQKSGLYIEITC